jgi:oxalate---CoA ligase
LSTLFHAQTIEEVAVFFSPQKSIDTWQSLVKIKSGNPHKPPLFCIHALWGNILFYRNFNQYLTTDRSVYGLQSRGFDGEQQPCDSIPEMAANYIKEIQSVQPQGPYFLLGFSLGGLIAFEIALQLQSQGQKIQMLTLIDPSCPKLIGSDLDDNGIADDASLLTKFAYHLQALRKLNIQERNTYITEQVQYHFTVGKANIFYKAYLRYIKKSINELRLLDIVLANEISRKNYLPSLKYLDKIVILKAEESGLSGEENSELKWEFLTTEGVDIVYVPGSHLNMMKEPNIQTLCAKFNICLNRYE